MKILLISSPDEEEPKLFHNNMNVRTRETITMKRRSSVFINHDLGNFTKYLFCTITIVTNS